MVISLEKKLEAIHRLDKGESLKKVAQDYGVGENTVGDWRRNRKQIENYVYQSASKEASNCRSTLKKSSCELLEEALLLWFCQAREQGFPVSGPIIQEKALSLNLKLNSPIEKFEASKGLLSRFKNRHAA